MRKIPTLFVRDPDDRKHVIDEVTPGCEWVIAGQGVATRKWDGTCVMIDDAGGCWARREVKPGKQPPPNFHLEEFDPVTDKRVGWEPMEQSGFAKFFDEACTGDGQVREEAPLDYGDLRAWLLEQTIEGLVWHHPDGRMAKLKRRDFSGPSKGDAT